MNQQRSPLTNRWQLAPAVGASALLLIALWGATAFPRSSPRPASLRTAPLQPSAAAPHDPARTDRPSNPDSRAESQLTASGALSAFDESAAPPPRTLGSGLVVQDLVQGNGAPCAEGDTLRIRFIARLWPAGTVYDSTALRRRDFTLDLANPNVITGLREGLPGLRPGGIRRLTIPHALAYGENGRDPIPPRTDLRFTVELLEILGRPESQH